MPRNFLPGSDAGLRDWSGNVARLVGADPSAFGVPPGRASAYAQLQAAFAAAYQRAVDPLTQTPGAVAAKNAQRAALVRESRLLARVLRGQGLDDGQMIELGLTPRPRKYRRATRPTHAPTVHVAVVDGGWIELRLGNRMNPTRRGRPVGVAMATLFWCAGEAARPISQERSLSESGWLFAGNHAKVRWVERFPRGVSPGEPLWFTACWNSARQERGPFADPVKLVVGFDGTPGLEGGLRMVRPARPVVKLAA